MDIGYFEIHDSDSADEPVEFRAIIDGCRYTAFGTDEQTVTRGNTWAEMQVIRALLAAGHSPTRMVRPPRPAPPETPPQA